MGGWGHTTSNISNISCAANKKMVGFSGNITDDLNQITEVRCREVIPKV